MGRRQIVFWLLPLIAGCVSGTDFIRAADVDLPVRKEDVEGSPDAEVRRLIVLLNGEDVQKRAEAVVALGRLKEKAAPAVERLVELLAETQPRVTVGRRSTATSQFASETLSSIGADAAPSFLKGLSHENPNVRAGCAGLLGRLKHEPAIPGLIERLGDGDRTVAGSALSALKQMGPPAVKPLLKVLRDGLKIPPPKKVWVNGEHPDPDDPLTLARQKRNYAANALGGLKDPAAIGLLLDALETKDNLLRRWAGGALSRMKSEECQEVLAREDVIQRLLKQLRTDNRGDRNYIITVLGGIPKEHRSPIIAALDDPDRRVRTSLFWMWIRNSIQDDHRVVPFLLKRIEAAGEDADALAEPAAVQERATALQVLRQILHEIESEDRFVPLLILQLRDPSSRLRAISASVLVRAAESGHSIAAAVVPLVTALEKETNQGAQQNLMRALGAAKDARAVDVLVHILKKKEIVGQVYTKPRSELTPEEAANADSSVRESICRALAEIGDPKAIPALRERLRLKEPFVIEALGKLGDGESVPAMLFQLQSESVEMQIAAAKGLKEAADPRSVRPLIVALENAVKRGFRQSLGQSHYELIRQLSEALAATKDPRAAVALVASVRSGPCRMSDFDEEFYSTPTLEQRGHGDARWRGLYDLEFVAVPALTAELMRPHLDLRKPAPGTSTAWSREVCASALDSVLHEEGGRSADNREAEDALIHVLAVNEPAVQLHAARALGLLKSKRAVPELLRVFDSAIAKSAVPRPKVPPESDPFPGLFFGDRERQIRPEDELTKTLANALSWIRVPAAAGRFEKLLSQSDPEVREAGIFGLLSSKHPRTVELLLARLDDEFGNVRAAAARQLGFAGDRRAVAPLLQLLKTEPKRPPRKRRSGFSDSEWQPPNSVLAMTVQSLGMLDDASVADVLVEWTSSKSARVRSSAVLALVRLRDERGSEALRKIMNGEDRRSRQSVMGQASHLARFADDGYGPKLSLPSARAIFRDNARHFGVSSLRGFSDAETVALLRARCRDENERVRAGTLRYLLATTATDRFEVLKSFLQDKSPACRAEAAKQFSKLFFESESAASRPAPGEAVTAVASLLNDDDSFVRTAALRSLESLLMVAPQVVVQHLPQIRRLTQTDKSPEVRQWAAQVLKRAEPHR